MDGHQSRADAQVHLGGRPTREDGDGVRTTLELSMAGPLAWLADLIAGSRVRSYVDMESNGLKRAAESG
ncbi:hypothetical protein LAUMK191_05462 [Mycobacterium attenuatum]|uniref:hypothetical protein n=1 Tax=Mycobacterium attenuatum TaxID=2341086 RepID=UPI000F1B4FEF|nr:hypothetical protein [Mycobacterium attenuatum]VBA60332.1 hypothetical protein LAUMK191_05462 [Mycobacterium attenuatum]